MRCFIQLAMKSVLFSQIKRKVCYKSKVPEKVWHFLKLPRPCWRLSAGCRRCLRLASRFPPHCCSSRLTARWGRICADLVRLGRRLLRLSQVAGLRHCRAACRELVRLAAHLISPSQLLFALYRFEVHLIPTLLNCFDWLASEISLSFLIFSAYGCNERSTI